MGCRPACAWPLMDKKATALQYEKVSPAMAPRGKHPLYRLNVIQPRHWQTLAEAAGIEGLWERMIETVERAASAFYSLDHGCPKTSPNGCSQRSAQASSDMRASFWWA